jgi:glycopeptide antibiotics resistance protein
MVAAIELAQLFVFSRVFDVDDLIWGASGVGIGVWLARRTSIPSAPLANIARWARLGATCWMLVLFAWHWYPFDFTLDPASFRTRLPEFVTVPFRAYYTANPFDALDDAAGKAMLAVPLGALLWFAWPPGPASNTARALRTCGLLVMAAICFLAIELGQTLLPARFPDISDVMIGVAGAAVGMTIVAAGLEASGESRSRR